MTDISPSATDDASSTDADSNSTLDSLSDPEDLRDREEVRFTHEEAVHDDRDHCNVDIEGRAVVGVTNDAGEVLLAVHKEEEVAMLPHGAVESGGDDWVAVARRKGEITTDLAFEIEDVEVVREIDHFAEGEDEPHATTYGVVFHASFVGDPESTSAENPSHPDNEPWDADWFGAVPENIPEGSGLVEDDIRLFVD